MDNLLIVILLGILLLGFSIRPIVTICKKTKDMAWSLLLVLVTLFIFGYCWILHYFANNTLENLVVISISLILFGGGIFVFLIMRLSLKSILEIEKSENHQRFLAEHDHLTSLPNRKCFFNLLNAQVNNAQPFSLFLFDLSNFKRVNELYGNSFGDELLRKFSITLNLNLLSIAELHRVGGDEFALILDSTNEQDILGCFEVIRDSVEQPFFINEQKIWLKLKVGVSSFPQDALYTNELFKNADLALLEAKSTQHLFVHYFEELSERADDFLDMTTKIKNALSNHEFELYLQPIFCTRFDEMHGAEVLIRWPQKDGSFIAPEQFIKVAERTGMILNITQWVVIETVKNLRHLKLLGFTGTMHVNLSTRDLESESFVESIEKLLDEDPTLSDYIVFEITEGAMMTSLDAARTMMNKLNSRGFEFSVDDFGTGFSSLSLLRELPINQIKIDRSFINNMLTQIADYAIVESTLFLANRLNCNVVAEGIETKALQEALKSMNCEYLQGYYFSKPLPIDRFIEKYINNVGYK
ncbi:putative bifunctional diguanylate cyclase/phosphodiesterase [Pseudoalteromonas sp. 10-33]|uniref:putative bifunctional diguanylate cyclase/phosphodiesterase n=1 Tax=Pseudoalteromonas sp. 10-33 TaxID=1761890 RepID=UPI0007321219|nr:GGDEF domain-containing phosphodiesterase [Pseudoalteromonas sp. 10-33]KTF10285.1 diguanylate phosphodiesterase [Pseudoalteromonas sp. 10-33]